MPPAFTRDDLRSLDDLAKFPFTAKARPARQLSVRDVRRAAREGRARARIVAARLASRRSSATRARTSTPGRLLMARSIRAAGGRPGDIVHVAYGYGLFTGGLGAHYGAERLGCTVIPMSGGQTERQVQLICDFKPDIIMVTPSYMLAIAEEFARQGLDPRASSLRVGIFGAEPWTDAMRAPDRGGAGHRCDRHLWPVRSHGTGRCQ